MYSEKFLESSIKLLISSFSVMLLTFYTRRTLKGHSRCTPRGLGAPGHLGTWELEGHSDTQSFEVLYFVDSVSINFKSV